MIEKTVEINNETGIHARPASMLVQEANKFDSEILIVKDDNQVNAKSIMGIMSLGISKSTKIKIKAQGNDEVEAVDSIVALIEQGFEN